MHRDRKGRERTFDFGRVQVCGELQRVFARWFAEKCAPGGGWDSLKSSEAMWFHLRAFARFCAEQDTPPQALSDITPALWNRWRLRRPEGLHGYAQVTSLGSFLRGHEELGEETRSAMAKRLPAARAEERALAPEEFEELRATARKMFRAAHLRIRANTEHLRQWREEAFEPGSQDWTIGEALDSLARTGFIPHTVMKKGTRYYFARFVAALGGAAPQHTWMRLFLTRAEAYALAVLLVMEFGLNATVVSELRTPRALAGAGADGFPIYRMELEKPRRGAGRRFETRNFPDTGDADTPGRLITNALEATSPARAVVTAADGALDFLLVWRNVLPGPRNLSPVPPFGIGLTKNASDSWLAATGLTGAPLRRLRKTVNALHRREPGQNSQDTHDSVYVLREPQVQQASVPVIAEGAEGALAHARHTVLRAQLADSAAVPGSQETPTAECTDYGNSPFTAQGTGCRASFLMCTACPNARIHPKHHARLAHLHRCLAGLRSVLGEETWAADWGNPFIRLEDLRRRIGAEAWATALAAVTSADRETIASLLEGRYDL
ncbi:hypothetical protein [Sinomonas sp. G460-2]|uniref:hypothetical protein n=1 Tax=Sinomonas sp. G460-2 TaxID=3393464 RepID=UPI0039EE5F9F